MKFVPLSFLIVHSLLAASPIVVDYTLTDLHGALHALQQNDHRKPRAFVFLGTECPVSNALTPALNALAAEFKGRVHLYGVV